MDDLEKMRRAKALDLSRRQAEADRAKLRREGVRPTTVSDDEWNGTRNAQVPDSGKRK